MRGGDEDCRRHERPRAVGLRSVAAVCEEQADSRMCSPVDRAARDGKRRRRDRQSRDTGEDEPRAAAHQPPLEKP